MGKEKSILGSTAPYWCGAPPKVNGGYYNPFGLVSITGGIIPPCDNTAQSAVDAELWHLAKLDEKLEKAYRKHSFHRKRFCEFIEKNRGITNKDYYRLNRNCYKTSLRCEKIRGDIVHQAHKVVEAYLAAVKV